MSKFLQIVENNNPNQEKDPDDKVVDSIRKLCTSLNIPYVEHSRGLLILNKHDENHSEEEAEDPAKMAGALGALMNVPDQKGIFKSSSSKKINDAKTKIANGISVWADKWLRQLNQSSTTTY